MPAPTSSPTLCTLTLPKAVPPLLTFLLHTLNLPSHVTMTKGAALTLTLAGGAPVTDYYTVLVTLQKSFASSVPLPSAMVSAGQSSITAKPEKNVGALLAARGEWDTWLADAPAPTLLDYHAFFSLSAPPEGSAFGERWYAAVRDDVEGKVKGGRGGLDPKVVGVLKVPEAAAAEPSTGTTFVRIGSGGRSPSAAAPPPSADANDKKKEGKKKEPAGGAGGMTEEEKAAAREKREKAKKEKAAKKASSAPAPAPAGPAGEHVGMLEIRCGKILKVWEHETADKLFCEEIDLGPTLGVRQIASGLRPFNKKEDMEGKHVLVLCNLKKRNLVGFPSHGMVMCSSNDDHTAVQLVVPDGPCSPGDRVVTEGFVTDPEPENKIAKKKIFEKVAPELTTDGEGYACFRGVRMMGEKGGAWKAEGGMKGGHVA